MTHLIALVSGFGWHVQDLMRAARALSVQLDAILFTQLSSLTGGGIPQLKGRNQLLTQCEGVLVRIMPPGSLEQVVFRMDVLHRLSSAGVPVLNPPRAVEAAVDKYLALARIDASGLSVPRTWVGESAEAALEAFGNLGGDIVVKPLFGSEGRGIVRVGDLETAGRVFRALERIAPCFTCKNSSLIRDTTAVLSFSGIAYSG